MRGNGVTYETFFSGNLQGLVTYYFRQHTTWA